MSDLGNAEFVVSLDTSQLVNGSQKAKQTFAELANSGIQSMQTIQVQADHASQGVDKFTTGLEKNKASITSLIGPTTGLSASSASLYFSFDQLERASIRVEQGHLRVERAQDIVNKLQAEGKTNTDQYAQAMQNLQIQQERYDTAQNMVNQNMFYMSLSMVTLASSTIPSVIKAVQALKITQEEFAIALEASMPWLLAISGAIVAWEDVVTPLIKQNYNLDLGIQSNIEKMMAQHSQIDTNTSAMNGYSSVMGDTVIPSTDKLTSSSSLLADSITGVGSSVTATTSKLKTLQDEIQKSFEAFDTMKSLQNGFGVGQIPGMPFTGLTASLSPTTDLARAENDLLVKIKESTGSIADQRLEFNSLEGSIKMVADQIQVAYGEQGLTTFFGKIRSEAPNSIDQIDKLAASFEKVNSSISKTAKNIENLQKKASEQFNTIVADLAKTTGISEGVMTMSFSPGGAGGAFNQKLQDQWNQGIRNFGSVWETMNQGISRGLPFAYQTGMSMANGGGINTSSLLGGLKNNDIRNSLVELIANIHMFGNNGQLSYVATKDFVRQAINNGYALEQSTFEQNSPEWQKFYALRGAGLFTGDSNLSLEDNLSNAEKVYDAIFNGLRPDVASALRVANEQTYNYRLYADARRPGVAVTRYNFEVPTQAALDRARADSRFASESQFQDILAKAQSVLGLGEKQVIGSLANDQTMNDIQAELEFQSRLSAMSSGA